MRTQSLTVSHMVPQCQFIMPHVMQPQVVGSCRPRADSLADASALPDEMMPHVTQAQVSYWFSDETKRPRFWAGTNTWCADCYDCARCHDCVCCATLLTRLILLL
jgi:hypothetical protein